MTKTRLKPYAMAGSGRLTSAIRKDGNVTDGWTYRFNIFRTDHETGSVGQWLQPDDIEALLKLVRVLAIELVDDGCLEVSLRRKLQRLANVLEIVLVLDDESGPINGIHQS